MSGAWPVTQPSEQYGPFLDGPNAFLQLCERILVRPYVLVPDIGARTLPFGFPEYPSVHVQSPVGVGPLFGLDSHSELFLQLCPSPLFPDAAGISKDLSPISDKQ